MNISFHYSGIAEIPFGSVWYALTVALRYDVLRKPLGLQFTAEQLAAEENEHHIACIENGIVTGCLVLVPKENGVIKMRQVAVNISRQNKGIGLQMMKFSEAFAVQRGYDTMDLHARTTAVPFYLKQQYQVVGDEFIEVTIPHFRMVKKLK
jgi:predicted GNAT family N-acyltransferase